MENGRSRDDATETRRSPVVLAVCLATLTSCLWPGCADEPEAPLEDAGLVLYDEGLAMARAAGEDATRIRGVVEWIDARLLENVDSDIDERLLQLRGLVGRWMGDAFAKFAHLHAQTGNPETCRRLATWAEGVEEDERASPHRDRRIVERLSKSLRKLYLALLTTHPDDDALRVKAGYRRAERKLEDRVEAPYLEEEHRDEIKAMQQRIAESVEVSPSGTRWLAEYWGGEQELAELITRLDALQTSYRKRLEDPFEKSAAKLFEITANDVTEGLNESYHWAARTFKPYLLLIEKDQAWNETEVAEEKSRALLELHETFYRNYQEVLGLEPIDRPVPVVVFKRREAYYQYARKRGADRGSLGHFEPWTGRLVVNDGTNIGTVFHEGTHQLVAYNTERKTGTRYRLESYWFQEGVAEFFGANHRYLDPKTKDWRYEIGLLQTGRISYWRQNEHKAFKLWDLLALTYQDRETNKGGGNDDLNLFAYSQGWFLVYFLNNFLVDDEGVVQIGAVGKYRKHWLKYFRGELEGKTGREFFLECLDLRPNGKLDEAAYERFEAEFMDYYEWMNRKMSMKYHTKENRLVPWDEVENKGKIIGDRWDDMLKIK